MTYPAEIFKFFSTVQFLFWHKSLSCLTSYKVGWYPNIPTQYLPFKIRIDIAWSMKRVIDYIVCHFQCVMFSSIPSENIPRPYRTSWRQRETFSMKNKRKTLAHWRNNCRWGVCCAYCLGCGHTFSDIVWAMNSMKWMMCKEVDKFLMIWLPILSI